MRVLMVCRQFWPYQGGLESASLLMAKGLSQKRHQVDVVTLNCRIRNPQSSPLPSDDRLGPIHIRRVASLSRNYCLPVWKPPQSHYDVVHLNGIDGFLELVHWFNTQSRIPVVLQSHGLIFHTTRLLRLKNAYWRHLFTKRAQSLTVVASSKSDANKLAEVGVASTVIPNPVSLVGFPENPDRPIDLLYLGRMAEHKGLPQVLAVFLKMQEKWPHIQMVFAGEDWDGTLKALLPLPKGVTWLGQVTEQKKRWLLQSAKIALFPSRAEGFGITVIEAMSAGSVVVANDIEVYGEIVEHEVNGYLSCYQDINRTAKLLESLLEKDSNQLFFVKKQGFQTAQLYDPDRIANLLLGVYHHAQESHMRKYRRQGGINAKGT
ncbi:MAG: glycosyltransferase family 4 protein [Sulfobacillus sp.]